MQRNETINDKWARIFGIPAVALFHTLVMPAPQKVQGNFLLYFCIGLVVTTVIWEANRFLVIRFRRRYPLYSDTPKRIGMQFVVNLSLSAILMLGICSLLCSSLTGMEFSLKNVIPNLISGLSLTLVISIIYECVYFFGRWKDSIVEAENLKRENLRFQFETLKSQVNPHFLFNSLNTLTSLIEEEPSQAVNFVQHLSQVYRYVLLSRERELIPLEEEIGFIRSYLFLLEIRFGSNLKSRIDIPQEQLKRMLPPLAVQLLVENAIKHNVVSGEHPLTLTIGINRNGQLVVENSLHKKQVVEASSGFGLKNIINRYKLLGSSGVEIASGQDRFSVALPLLQPALA